MRVVHLINQASHQASATTMHLLANSQQKIDAQHHVLLIGGEPLADAALQAGVTSPTHLGAPGGHALAALPRFKHWLAKHEQPDIIHCYSVGTLLLTSLCCRILPRILTLCLTPSSREIHLLRMLVSEASDKIAIVATTSTIARSLITQGVRQESVDVLRPGIDMGLIQTNQRDQIREQWKLAGDKPFVAMLLSDPPTASDAATATLMLGLANVAMNDPKRPIHLLVHPDQKNRLAALNPLRPLHNEHLLLTDPRVEAPWEVLPGVDVAITLADAGAGLSLLWTMAANVPVIGQATVGNCELIEDHHSALLTHPNPQNLRHLAGKLQQILTDTQLAYKLRDTARHEAFSFFSRQRYAGDLKTVYQQLIDAQQLKVPDMPSTGGLRFSGRG